MVDEGKLISVNELSDAGCYALTYAQALIAGEGSRQWQEFQAALKRTMRGHGRRRTERDLKALLATGLAELMDLGVIECERDETGAYVPKVLHEEKLVPAVAPIIMRDRQ